MSRTTRRLAAACAAILLALLAAATAGAQNPTLTASVGPGFTIALTDASGQPVRQLDPGTYDIVVHDQATIHNFHLQGPGVDVSTAVETTEDTTWTVTLEDGTYTYFCDPHSTTMRGAFAVGSGAAAATQPAPAAKPEPAPQRLVATVGPGFTISVAPKGGFRAGPATIVVRDRAAMHDFHLVGPGVNRKTGVAFRGTVTWRVSLRKGVYRFVCDPHARGMKGSFRVA